MRLQRKTQRHGTLRRRSEDRRASGYRAGELLEPRVLLASIAGKVWNDYDADGVVDAGEPGLAAVAVYQDVNGNGTRDVGGDQLFASADVPKFIPDLGQILSNLVVSGVAGAI